MGPQFHQTVGGVRFFEGQLPALIGALTVIGKAMELPAGKPPTHFFALGTKQTACNIIAAGVHAGGGGVTGKTAACIAIETYDEIERMVKGKAENGQ